MPVKGICCCFKLIWIPGFFVTFSWAVKVFSHFHGFTNWKQTLKGKKFEQKRILEKGERERGRFCVIQMRFAIVGQARNEQHNQLASQHFFSTCHTVVIAIRVFIRSRNFSLLHPTENLSDRPVTHSTFFLCNHNVFVFWVDLHIRKADRRFGLDVSSGGHFKDSRRHSRGADTRACNLSVLTPYHPDRNGIPRFENYLFSLPN